MEVTLGSSKKASDYKEPSHLHICSVFVRQIPYQDWRQPEFRLSNIDFITVYSIFLLVQICTYVLCMEALPKHALYKTNILNLTQNTNLSSFYHYRNVSQT